MFCLLLLHTISLTYFYLPCHPFFPSPFLLQVGYVFVYFIFQAPPLALPYQPDVLDSVNYDFYCFSLEEAQGNWITVLEEVVLKSEP